MLALGQGSGICPRGQSTSVFSAELPIPAHRLVLSRVGAAVTDERSGHTTATSRHATITQIRSSLETGQETAAAIVASALARVEERNAELNAIVTSCAERATDAANAVDVRRARGDARPLDGVPCTVKDVIAVEGVRLTAGSRLFADQIARETAPAVARLEAAGAVVVGKANCPEFGLDPHTENDLFGATVNPLDASRTPGGSSGGDAAAVAAGLVAFGIGSDYGGSIRWPAQCTGTVGFRPTAGLVSGAGHFPFIEDGRPCPPNSSSFLASVQTMAPLARSVDDAWAVLERLAGPGGGDARATPVPLGDPSAVDVTALSCAWTSSEGSVDPDDSVVAMIERAASTLRQLGMSVAEQRPGALGECEDVYAACRAADGLGLHRALVAGREAQLTPTMRTWFERDGEANVVEAQALAAERDRLRASVLEFMDDRPIMVLPVSNGPAFALGAADFDERFRLLTPCRAISLLGLPSCAVPVSRSPEGAPLSAQIVGRPFNDHEVAAVAGALERALRG